MVESMFTSAYAAVIDAVVRIRQEADLTQRQLAERLRLAQNTVHRMEVGTRRCDAVELIGWARACGASPRTIFDRLARRVER